jgi:hypothetical protein
VVQYIDETAAVGLYIPCDNVYSNTAIVTQTDFVTGYSEYQTALKHIALRTSKNGIVKVLRVKQAIRENDKIGFGAS